MTPFADNLTKYAAYYNPSRLFNKLKKVAKLAGVKTVHGLLILYYATFDKELPMKDRVMVAAALGYFILPLDLIPDAIPGGFADDGAAIAYVLRHVWKNLSKPTFEKARHKLNQWFPSSDTPADNPFPDSSSTPL